MAAQPEKTVPAWMQKKGRGPQQSKTPPGFIEAIKRRKAKMATGKKPEEKSSE